MVPVIKYNKKL